MQKKNKKSKTILKKIQRKYSKNLKNKKKIKIGGAWYDPFGILDEDKKINENVSKTDLNTKEDSVEPLQKDDSLEADKINETEIPTNVKPKDNDNNIENVIDFKKEVETKIKNLETEIRDTQNILKLHEEERQKLVVRISELEKTYLENKQHLSLKENELNKQVHTLEQVKQAATELNKSVNSIKNNSKLQHLTDLDNFSQKNLHPDSKSGIFDSLQSTHQIEPSTNNHIGGSKKRNKYIQALFFD